MNDRWEINKLGLVNFWHYDMEEFDLEDGKLLQELSYTSIKMELYLLVRILIQMTLALLVSLNTQVVVCKS